jgi:dipeptidyl-peptidase-4
MGTPKENPEGYARSSVMRHIPSIGAGAQLLIVHGLLDENVHFRHTARLINELIHHKKQYELLVFPNERHTPRGKPDRVYMEQRIAEFFQRAFALADGDGPHHSQG